jgi:hypothetical protein
VGAVATVAIIPPWLAFGVRGGTILLTTTLPPSGADAAQAPTVYHFYVYDAIPANIAMAATFAVIAVLGSSLRRRHEADELGRRASAAGRGR